MVAQVTLVYRYLTNFAGVSVIHFQTGGNLATLQSGVISLMQSAAPLMPDSAEIAWDGTWDNLDTSTGQLLGSGQTNTAFEEGQIVGGEIVPQNASVLYSWQTGGVVNGHRVKGRTYVPLIDTSINVNGGVSATVTNPQLQERVVWSRPLKDASGTVVRPGSEHAVTGYSVSAEWATMGSRRRV